MFAPPHVFLFFLSIWTLSRGVVIREPSIRPISIPLSRHRTQVDPSTKAYELRTKYGLSQGQPRTLPVQKKETKRTTGSSLPIDNSGGDSSFLATVNIGTPQQSFSVILDTGSSDLWLANTNCQQCPPSQPVFDPSKSSTFRLSTGKKSKSPVQLSYGTGNVSGQVATDCVNVANLTVTKQTFLSADQLSVDFAQNAIQGIMGLAFSSISSIHATPFWQTLLNEKKLSSPDMAFWLKRADPQSMDHDQPGGILTLGGTNQTLYTGDIEFLDFPAKVQPRFWWLSVANITINDKPIKFSVDGNSALAAIDTGTTLLGGPTDVVTSIWNTVGGEPSPDNPGFFRYPCATEISVSISFGGRSWPILPQDMVFQQITDVGNDSLCLGSIFDATMGTSIDPDSATPRWIIGDTFLKNVYTVFHASPTPSIGFAELSTFARGQNPSTPVESSTRSSPASSGSTGVASNNTKSEGILIMSASRVILALAFIFVATMVMS